MGVPSSIADIIYSNKTSLGDNPALPPDLDDKFLMFVVNKHYDSLLKHFDSIDIEELNHELSISMTECKKIESQNKEALEQLCTTIVNEIFGIPNDTLLINVELVDRVDSKQERLTPENISDYSFDSIDDMNSITAEIYKRRLLNSLIMGAAMYYAEDIDAYADALNNIDPKLHHLYKKIMCINSLLLFHTSQNERNKHMDGGRVDVYISNDETPVKIMSQGVIFPVLLEETIKGLLELAISHGLPEDRSKAEFITHKTDFKLAEIWDQRLGLPLWKTMVSAFRKTEIDPIEVGLNFLFMEVSTLEPQQFNPIMQEIFANTNSGLQLIDNLSNQILNQKEQDDFDDYMANMQQNGEHQLNDGDFTPDELINDDLCSSAILDETY